MKGQLERCESANSFSVRVFETEPKRKPILKFVIYFRRETNTLINTIMEGSYTAREEQTGHRCLSGEQRAGLIMGSDNIDSDCN